jgi:hypothetical protein
VDDREEELLGLFGIGLRGIRILVFGMVHPLSIAAAGLLHHHEVGQGNPDLGCLFVIILQLTSGVGGSRAGYAFGPFVQFHLARNTSDARL